MIKASVLVPIFLIALLLGFFAVWSGSAIGTLSATADEPLHAIGAWQAHFESDYRVNREDPPLWLHWVGLFLRRDDVRVPYTAADWARSKYGVEGQELYLRRAVWTRAAQPEEVVRHGRPAMLLVALALGISLAAVAWWLGGPIAGVAATAAFSLEPLMLGHGMLVKNDLAIALAFLWIAVAMWRVVTIGSFRAILGLAAALTLAVTLKFSGLLAVGIVALALLGRAMGSREWRLGTVPLALRWQRLAGAAMVMLLIMTVLWAGIWTVYGWRFRPSPGPEMFDMEGAVKRAVTTQLFAEAAMRRPGTDPMPTPEEIAVQERNGPSRFLRTILMLHSHRILPESYLAGFLYTYGSTLYRPSFLMGQYSDVGFRYYFPAAWLFKTPLTLIGLVATGTILMAQRQRWRKYWFLLLPVGVYMASAIAGRLNIGLRHLTPVYPFLFVGIGLLIAWTWRTWSKKWAAGVSLVLLALLAIEVVPHRLRYIQFFNAAAGGERGGLALLGDSNLDWGQDLYRLVEWQKGNPDVPLYLCYFGPADVASVGLKYHNTTGSWALGPAERPTAPGIFAISASHLQGTYFYRESREEMALWRQREPIEVLGGTIYLYRVPE